MKTILITGGSGFVGRGIVKALLARGDRVTVLTRDVRRAKQSLPASARVAVWTPDKEGPWCEELEVVDAVVHLAGESIARRWTDAARREIERSRLDSTKLLVEAIGRAQHKPEALLCASAVGYYGPRPGDEVLDEEAERGQGFLADVVARWEEAARAAEAHGVRTVELRFGIVLGEGGGALEKMLKPFKLFAGGPIAGGKQVVSWVHRDDVVGMTLLALDNPAVKGPINVVAPSPATSEELARAIGVVMNRPSWLRVPEAAIRIGMGDAAEMLTTGQRVQPKRAIELGYEFRYARLLPALESILGR
ncbi:MAG: TIGR01777 family protein [Polyangiaceae bacterium]|nr:TIGR01777 family protein [Polyangiaceae bacterium]